MNLAELYLLTRDLSVLRGMHLTDFIVKGKYIKHNFVSGSIVFPLSFSSCRGLFPTLTGVGRWGRNILFNFTSCTIVLKMSYKTLLVASKEMRPPLADDSDVSLRFARTLVSDDRICMFFKDPMRCGAVTIYPIGEIPEEFAYLGMDVLDTAFTTDYLLSELFRGLEEYPERGVKSFLMDRSVIAWLDNEVASEALFISGVNPYCSLSDFDPGLLSFVVKAIKIVYRRTLEHLRNDFQLTINIPVESIYSIYKREGQECPMCEGKIVRSVIDGQSTYWCPKCQTSNAKNSVT